MIIMMIHSVTRIYRMYHLTTLLNISVIFNRNEMIIVRPVISLDQYNSICDFYETVTNTLVKHKLMKMSCAENISSKAIPAMCKLVMESENVNSINPTALYDVIFNNIIEYVCDEDDKDSLNVAHNTLYKVAVLTHMMKTPSEISVKIGIPIDEVEYAMVILKTNEIC